MMCRGTVVWLSGLAVCEIRQQPTVMRGLSRARSQAIVLLLVTLTCSLAVAQTQTPNRSVVSPEVLPDNRVTFRIHAPNAVNVSLWGEWVGQGLGSREDLKRGEQGVWAVTVGPLPADFYNYIFNVDGTRMADPRSLLGFRSHYSILSVPGKTASFADNQDVPHGHIRRVWYKSGTLGMQRRLHVYTPPGYDQHERSYPALYLLHGRGGDDSSWSDVGRAGFIMDNLLADSKAVPMLIVMPNGSLPNTRRPSGFVPELINEVIPFVEESFRVRSSPKHRALAGMSMGAAQVLSVASEHFREFSHIGVWGTGVELSKETMFLNSASEVNQHVSLLLIAVGDNDRAMDGAKAMSELFSERGISHRLKITDGGHTTINWRRYLRDFAEVLFQ